MTAGLRTYLDVLAVPAAARTFAAAVLARLSLSMAPIGLVLLVQQVRGSYASGGLVTGAFTIATAIGSPVWGRAMDRRGQSRVIVPTVLGSSALLAAVALAAVAGAPDVLLAVLAAGSGLLAPPFSAAMRASWRVLLPDPGQRRAAFAMDASAVEAVYVVGPLLLSLLLVVLPPVAPLLVTAGVQALGGVLYATSGSARRRPERRPPGGAVQPPAGFPPARAVAVGLGVTFAVMLTMALSFGAVDTSLAATARSVLHHEGYLGLLFAAIASGSTLGGLVYGTLPAGPRESRRLPLLMTVFAAGLAVVAVLVGRGDPPLGALLPVLFVVGLTISPNLIIGQNLIDRLAPRARASEAQAWLSTSLTAGNAGGTAVAGALVQAFGAASSFAAGAAALGVAVVVAVCAAPSFAAVAPGQRAATARSPSS